MFQKLIHTNKLITISLVIIGILFCISACKSAQNLSGEEKTAHIRDKLDSQNYTFEARKALPVSGGNIDLTTGGYTLHVSNDSVIVYLPYFGRAYVAPINSSDGGIKFTSTNFDYNITWNGNTCNINIEPNDTREKVRLSLSIFNNGKGSLTVTDNNRQPISFYGEIVE